MHVTYIYTQMESRASTIQTEKPTVEEDEVVECEHALIDDVRLIRTHLQVPRPTQQDADVIT